MVLTLNKKKILEIKKMFLELKKMSKPWNKYPLLFKNF